MHARLGWPRRARSLSKETTMPLRRPLLALSFLVIAATWSLAQAADTKPAAATKPAAPAATAPVPNPNDVPDGTIKNLDATFRLPGQPQSQEEHLAMASRQMAEVLKFGAQIEKQYPAATNLYKVRLRMLMASDFLVRFRPSEQMHAQRLSLARQIMASNPPADIKVTADYFITLDKVSPATGTVAGDAAEQIRALAARYAKTESEPAAVVRACQLAKQIGLTPLFNELVDRLDKDFATNPIVNAFLRQAGRKPPFVADLTLLDGKKLTFPGDMKGKVLVIDFWATWCAPCVAALPHMKEVYAKYSPKGVEFVGISLDKEADKQKLLDFIKDKGIAWPQTFSGKYWQDPTAERYGVQGIPSVWVIGKDGRILSADAAADLEGALDQALAESSGATTKPK
jgi:thiol-disulfide isomerase/thioredoxin